MVVGTFSSTIVLSMFCILLCLGLCHGMVMSRLYKRSRVLLLVLKNHGLLSTKLSNVSTSIASWLMMQGDYLLTLIYLRATTLKNILSNWWEYHQIVVFRGLLHLFKEPDHVKVHLGSPKFALFNEVLEYLHKLLHYLSLLSTFWISVIRDTFNCVSLSKVTSCTFCRPVITCL